MYANLIRVSTHPDHGTFGVLTLDGQPVAVTVEPYKMDNKVSISCIPTGQYICKRYSSSRYPNTFEVTGVADRSKILFHTGNTDDNTEGCIILGANFGTLSEDLAVLNSRITMRKFMQRLCNTDKFMLTIREAW